MQKFEYGIKLDMLHDQCAKRIRERVTQVRDWANTQGFRELEQATDELYKYEEQMYLQARYKWAPKMSTCRYNLIRGSHGFMVLTYSLKKVKWEIIKALEAGNVVVLFMPYQKRDLVKFTSLEMFEEWCKRFECPAYAEWIDTLDASKQALMSTSTGWLGTDTLRDFMNTFNDVDEFMGYVDAEMHRLNELGAWDVDTAGTLKFVEAKNSWVDKETGTKWFRSQTTRAKFWTGTDELSSKDVYTVTDEDRIMMFLHLTYLESINYKPLKRIYAVGKTDTYTGRELWNGTGSALEDMLRATPIYVDMNEKHSAEQYEQYVDDEAYGELEYIITELIGVDFLNEMSYEQALEVIRYNIKHYNK